MASEGHSQEQQGILPDGSTSDPGALVLANRVPTHSSASTSFFNASRNLAIGGGTFVSNQTTHNVYFNIPNQNGIPAGTGAANTSGSSQPNDGPLSRVSRWFTGLTRFRVSRSLRRRSPQLTALNGGILTEPRVDQEVYKRHMYPKQLGYPLWIPQSNMSLPRPYRREGVRIGDVGIITPEGGFDYLFNICLPHNHPTNNRAPHDFVPLDGPFDYFEARPYSEGTYLASEQIHASQTHFEYRFRTLAPEGAILTLPRALFLKRLVNVERFNEYIERHAKSWYAYTNNVRGRGVQNGDLRVVFGYHKSSAWGMATFSNGAQNTPQTLRFFSRLPVNEPIPAYMWEGTGVALTKAGPEPADNEGLADDRVQAMNLRNQCLFVGSRSISLSDAAWATIPFKTIVNSEDQKSVKPSLLPQEGHDDDLASIVALNLVPASTQNIVKKKSVIIGLDDLPPDTVDHSKAINMLLLQQDPDAEVAVTDDNEWCSVLKQGDDLRRVSSSELFTRISSRCHIYKSPNGLVKFYLKDPNTVVPATETDNMLIKLRARDVSVQKCLLGNLPDFQHIERILHLAFISNSGDSRTSFPTLHPFLMDNPHDLFTFDKLLEPILIEAGFAMPRPQLTDNGIPAKIQLYKKLESTLPTDPMRRSYFGTLADIAWKLYLQYGRPDELDETIWLYEKAVTFTPIFSVQSLVPMLGLCSALYRRFFIARNLQDFVYLARYTRQLEVLDLSDLVIQLLQSNVSSGFDHPTRETTSREPYLLKLREIGLQDPHGWTNFLFANSNIPNPKTIIEKEDFRKHFAKMDKALASSSSQGRTEVERSAPPSKDPTADIGLTFHNLIALTCKWVDLRAPDFSVLWLYGPSATAMTSHLVQNVSLYGVESHIGSSFTFSEKAAWNDEAYQTFPTIALKLAYYMPGFMEQYKIIMATENRRNLMTSSLAIQFWGLIVDPICKLESYPEHTPTVIINGVDNCEYETARIILSLIADALMVFKLPLRFIITSNKDTRMQDLFNRPFLSKISRQFFIGSQPSDNLNIPHTINDPADILRQGFLTLYKRHPSLKSLGIEQWPPKTTFDTLMKRSQGNPIYANTVVNFVGAPHDDPRANLELVLQPTAPIRPEQELTACFADLDCLFTRILSTHRQPKALVWALGILLVLHDCAQPQAIFEHMFATQGEFYNSVLQVLRSLMHFPKKENDPDPYTHPWGVVKKHVPNKDEMVKSPFIVLALLSLSTTMPTAFTIPLAFRDRVHDSFYDFLVNPERSGQFYIDIPFYHGKITLAGLALIAPCMWRPLRLNIHRNPPFSEETLDYLKFHLPDHFAQCSDSVREQIIEGLQTAMQSLAQLDPGDVATYKDDFLHNMAILINMMINNWDSFGEWAHISDKHNVPDKHKDFHNAMDAIRDDIFPHRKQPGKLRRTISMSGRLRTLSTSERVPK